MTDAAATDRPSPLGAGTLLKAIISLTFRRLPHFVVLGGLPWLILFIAFEFVTMPGGGWFPGVVALVSLAGIPVAAAISLGATVQAAHEFATGRRRSLFRNFAIGPRRIIWLSVTGAIALALIWAASLLLVLPGLWVASVLIAVVPCVMIDGPGIGALSRSAMLTRDYRWPIAGVLVIVGTLAVVLPIVVIGVLGTLTGDFENDIVLLPVMALIIALLTTPPMVAAALIRQRLVDLKEGVSQADLERVFA